MIAKAEKIDTAWKLRPESSVLGDETVLADEFSSPMNGYRSAVRRRALKLTRPSRTLW